MFQTGGIATQLLGGLEPITLNVSVRVGLSRSTVEEIIIVGASTENGRRVIINQIRKAQLNME